MIYVARFRMHTLKELRGRTQLRDKQMQVTHKMADSVVGCGELLLKKTLSGAVSGHSDRTGIYLYI